MNTNQIRLRLIKESVPHQKYVNDFLCFDLNYDLFIFYDSFEMIKCVYEVVQQLGE